MYGDMAVEHISGQFENPVAYNNGDANIELNPKSGICEFEITVPIDDYPELMISFCENPYMDAPMVYVPKDSVWEEIKKVQAGTTYELFGAGLGCYRKTEEVTEFFGTASVGMIFGEDGYGYGYMELPPSLQTNWLDLYGIVHINENMWNANGLNLWGRPTDDASQDGSGTWGIEIMAKIDNEDIFEYGIEFDLDICFYIVVPNKGPR